MGMIAFYTKITEDFTHPSIVWLFCLFSILIKLLGLYSQSPTTSCDLRRPLSTLEFAIAMVLRSTHSKIRKERGAQEEKCTRGRKRQRHSSSDFAAGGSHISESIPNASSIRPRKRRQRKVPLSRLEELPTEILHEIFRLSENLDLACSSTQLARVLASKHLYRCLAHSILERVIGFEDPQSVVDATALAAATRLLNARLLTWSFFAEWLRCRSGSDPGDDLDYYRMWGNLRPTRYILAPAKLLHGPWTPDALRLLQCVTMYSADISSLSLYHSDLAQQGLVEAVAEKRFDAISVLMRVGATTSQELLRKAIIENGCDLPIVQQLVRGVKYEQRYDAAQQRWLSQPSIDPFDPSLWAWIDRNRRGENSKGRRVKLLLQQVMDGTTM